MATGTTSAAKPADSSVRLFGAPLDPPFCSGLVQLNTPTFRGRLFVLRYGDRPVAALLGMQSGNTLECVLTAFDAHVSASSPGLLLFHVLCREAARMGIQRIHLTRGTEHYKERFENRIVTVSDAILGASPWTLYWHRRSILCQEWIRRTSWGPTAQRCVRRLRRLATHLPHGKLEKAWHEAVPGCNDVATIESDSFLTVTTSARET